VNNDFATVAIHPASVEELVTLKEPCDEVASPAFGEAAW